MKIPLLDAARIGRRDGEKWLLRDVSLTLHAGERLVVAGPSGAGKTVLLRTLAMLDAIDEGEIRHRGEAVGDHHVPQFRSEVMYLHQRPTLSPGTVEKNLQAPFEWAVHRSKSYDRKRAVELLATLGRDESFLAKRSQDLSGGEAQLAALVRAMLLGPDVMLLDEPTAALDGRTAEAVESLVDHWIGEQPERRAAVWISHSGRRKDGGHIREMHLRDGRVVEAN